MVDTLTLKFDVFFRLPIVKSLCKYSDLYLIEFDNYSHQLPPNFGFISQISFQYVNSKFTVTVIKIETEPEKGFAKKDTN